MAGEGALRRALAEEATRRGSRRRWYLSLLSDPSAVLGGAVTLALVLVAVFAARLAPFDLPQAGDRLYFMQRDTETVTGVTLAHSPPFWLVPAPDDPNDPWDNPIAYNPDYPLGTDSLQRDMLSLLLYSTRYTLAVGLLAVALVTLVGTVLGLAAGWFGGVWEDLTMRAADVAESVPAFLACTLFAAVAADRLAGMLASAGLYFDAVPVMALVLSCTGWAPVSRLVRAQVLSLRHGEWVVAARATGVPTWRILLRHILPHTAGGALVGASSQLPVMLLTYGLLGIVGVGQQPPIDSLGELIFQEYPYTVTEPVFVLMPTILMIAMSLALIALTDGIQKALDPQRVGWGRGRG